MAATPARDVRSNATTATGPSGERRTVEERVAEAVLPRDAELGKVKGRDDAVGLRGDNDNARGGRQFVLTAQHLGQVVVAEKVDLEGRLKALFGQTRLGGGDAGVEDGHIKRGAQRRHRRGHRREVAEVKGHDVGAAASMGPVLGGVPGRGLGLKFSSKTGLGRPASQRRVAAQRQQPRRNAAAEPTVGASLRGGKKKQHRRDHIETDPFPMKHAPQDNAC